MFPTKCQGQSDRIGCPVISCFRQHLDFSVGFATKILNFNLPPPFCVFSVSLIHFTGGVFLAYTIYINLCNIPIYPISPDRPNLLWAPFYFLQGGSVRSDICFCCQRNPNVLSAPSYFMGWSTLSEWPVIRTDHGHRLSVRRPALLMA